MLGIPHLITLLIHQGPPIGQLPPAPDIMQNSTPHGARPGSTDPPASNVAPRAEPALMSFFERASNVKITNSKMNNIGIINNYGLVILFVCNAALFFPLISYPEAVYGKVTLRGGVI